MKYCEYCGSEAQNHYSNCHSCGAPFSIKTIYSPDPEVGGIGPTIDRDMLFGLMPLLISMAIVSYAIDKVGNLFRFKREKVEGIQPARYTYEKRRGYL